MYLVGMRLPDCKGKELDWQQLTRDWSEWGIIILYKILNPRPLGQILRYNQMSAELCSPGDPLSRGSEIVHHVASCLLPALHDVSPHHGHILFDIGIGGPQEGRPFDQRRMSKPHVINQCASTLIWEIGNACQCGKMFGLLPGLQRRKLTSCKFLLKFGAFFGLSLTNSLVWENHQ